MDENASGSTAASENGGMATTTDTDADTARATDALPATITDERSGISYSLVGDYYFPHIIAHVERDVNGEIVRLGRYGLMHKAFLKEHRTILYNTLLLTERLYPLCHEIDVSAEERRKSGCSEEVILAELVYC